MIPGERPKPQTRRRRRGETGRPPVILDPVQVRALATIHCTYEEAAHVLGVSEQTFNAKLRLHPELREAWQAGQAHGKTSIRRALFAAALGTGLKEETRTLPGGGQVHTVTKGVSNVVAQIWLSKQHLGMKDVHVVEHEGGSLTLHDLLLGDREEAAPVLTDAPPPPLSERH